jgi:hypothetical protein
MIPPGALPLTEWLDAHAGKRVKVSSVCFPE